MSAKSEVRIDVFAEVGLGAIAMVEPSGEGDHGSIVGG